MTAAAQGPVADPLWRAISVSGRRVRFRPGTTLVRQGDPGTHCYAVVGGEVLVSTTTSQGGNVILARRGPGTIIGELSALDGVERSATATAATEVTAVVLSADELDRLLRGDADLAVRELKRVSAQLRALTARYTMRNEELRTRIASLLLTHVRESGHHTVRASRQEVADWVGVTREAATRTLGWLERSGVVRLARGSITIVDDDVLAELVSA